MASAVLRFLHFQEFYPFFFTYLLYFSTSPSIAAEPFLDYSCSHASTWLFSRSQSRSRDITSFNQKNQEYEIYSSIRHENYWNVSHDGVVKYEELLNELEESRRKEYFSQFYLHPSQEMSPVGCYHNMNSIGQFINGANIYSFLQPTTTTTKTTKMKVHEVWNPLRNFENLDICSGFVENERYGHATYSRCLANRLQETGQSHSPIYGWSDDNFPIYGPYQANGILAQSSWRQRHYDSKLDSIGACKVETKRRACIFIDPIHPEKGVIELDSSQYGPLIDDEKSNEHPLGSLYEDYYYDMNYQQMNNVQSPYQEYLDEHNGHEHEPYGYHYHITINELHEPVFPFIIGPTFYGCQSNLMTKCCQSIQETLTNTCPLADKYSTCKTRFNTIMKYECSTSLSDSSSASSFSATSSSSAASSSSSAAASDSRQLDVVTPTWTFSPTLTPTAFQSPTFKPTISFISQAPTMITFPPTLLPTSNKHTTGNSDKSQQFTSNEIALLVLIVVGGIVVIGSIALLIYWHLYTRTAPGYTDASSSTYVERIKDFTSGLSLVDTASPSTTKI